MLPVLPACADALDTGTRVIVRHLVTITPVAGDPVYLTDHDADLTYGGHVFQHGGGTVPIVHLTRRRMESGTGISELEMELLCGSSATLNGKRLPVAVLDGDLRDAWVLAERVFMPTDGDLSLGTMHLFEGKVSEVNPSPTLVEITVEGLMGILADVQIPKTLFSPGCTNTLFDTQCGLSRAAYTVTGTITGTPTKTAFDSDRTDSGGGGLPILPPYFTAGVLTFKAGSANAGEARSVRAFSQPNGHFVLDRPLPHTPVAGDTFDVTPGCVGSMPVCHFVFANLDRFRATPFVPKSEITR